MPPGSGSTTPAAEGVTLGEVARMMSRAEAQLQALSAQVAHLASATTRIETELRGHVERQTDRTVRRDAQMIEVRSELDKHEQSIASAERWRWMMVGRMAGVMAGAGAGGAGIVTAVAKLWGS